MSPPSQKSAGPPSRAGRRPRSIVISALALAISVALLSLFGGSASAAPDPVKDAKAALAAATARRVATDQRLGDLRSKVRDLEAALATMDTEDAELTRELAAAKDAMREFAIAAYIDGHKAALATASLDPSESQSLAWQSTISVGQAASADEVAHRYEQLKIAAGPRRQAIGANLDDTKAQLVDAQNDAIQAAALERDSETALSREIEAARQREREARERQAKERAELAAARSTATAKPPQAQPVGAAAVAAPAPAAGASGSEARGDADGGAKGSPSPAESALLAKIRRCESGGNYRAVNRSGRYRGAYQFDFGTWAAVGGAGDPAAASPSEQDYRALLLLRARGSRPWPICGR